MGITPIWFEKAHFEFVESVLSLAKNELRHRGVAPQPLLVEEPPINLEADLSHFLGDYLSLALSANFGAIVPDRLDQIYTSDIRSMCEDAWNNCDKPIDLKFFVRVKLMVAQVFK